MSGLLVRPTAPGGHGEYSYSSPFPHFYCCAQEFVCGIKEINAILVFFCSLFVCLFVLMFSNQSNLFLFFSCQQLQEEGRLGTPRTPSED
jgi:hypothetical protein